MLYNTFQIEYKVFTSLIELHIFANQIKISSFFKENMENYGIIKLIENQRLSRVQLHFESLEYIISTSKKLYYKFLQIL
jgi:hypothetical protein